MAEFAFHALLPVAGLPGVAGVRLPEVPFNLLRCAGNAPELGTTPPVPVVTVPVLAPPGAAGLPDIYPQLLDDFAARFGNALPAAPLVVALGGGV